ncbi:unnamed protein product [Anisakis simplex]|uniref:O-fucosyltransferase family protein n=1 Tax=Anisakis simplex TaxID=6269 RepID=A0A0M3JL48_ANISI|nr:unnamed protein product [Anisakis simplex]
MAIVCLIGKKFSFLDNPERLREANIATDQLILKADNDCCTKLLRWSMHSSGVLYQRHVLSDFTLPRLKDFDVILDGNVSHGIPVA